jgi:hypothetical protein
VQWSMRTQALVKRRHACKPNAHAQSAHATAEITRSGWHKRYDAIERLDGCRVCCGACSGEHGGQMG